MQLAWIDYRKNGDPWVLHEIAWPLMRGAFEGYSAMLEENGDQLCLPVAVSPRASARCGASTSPRSGWRTAARRGSLGCWTWPPASSYCSRRGIPSASASWLFLVHGKPKKIRFDNGPEFRSKKLARFFQEQGVEAGFIEAGSPWQKGHIESFFVKLRDELLNLELFPAGKDLQAHLDGMPGPQQQASPLGTRRTASRNL